MTELNKIPFEVIGVPVTINSSYTDRLIVPDQALPPLLTIDFNISSSLIGGEILIEGPIVQQISHLVDEIGPLSFAITHDSRFRFARKHRHFPSHAIVADKDNSIILFSEGDIFTFAIVEGLLLPVRLLGWFRARDMSLYSHQDVQRIDAPGAPLAGSFILPIHSEISGLTHEFARPVITVLPQVIRLNATRKVPDPIIVTKDRPVYYDVIREIPVELINPVPVDKIVTYETRVPEYYDNIIEKIEYYNVEKVVDNPVVKERVTIREIIKEVKVVTKVDEKAKPERYRIGVGYDIKYDQYAGNAYHSTIQKFPTEHTQLASSHTNDRILIKRPNYASPNLNAGIPNHLICAATVGTSTNGYVHYMSNTPDFIMGSDLTSAYSPAASSGFKTLFSTDKGYITNVIWFAGSWRGRKIGASGTSVTLVQKGVPSTTYTGQIFMCPDWVANPANADALYNQIMNALNIT